MIQISQLLALLILLVLYILNIDCLSSVNITYYPSEWENNWRLTAHQLVKLNEPTRDWNKGCNLLKEQQNKVDYWLEYWETREKCTIKDSTNNLNSVTPSISTDEDYIAKQKSCHLDEWNSEILSYFVITDSSTGKELAKLPIEPLVSFLRHPKHLCIDNQHEGGQFWVNKDYMYPLMLSEVYPVVERTPRYAQKYFFDLGASLYSSGFGGASQEWFVETYRARGINFDRILAWEVDLQEPAKIFNAIPLKMFGRTSYYNIPASPVANVKENALTVMKQICHVDDFVVIKIDIDNPEVESAMIDEILSDVNVSSLIDELFYEHHVSHSPMEKQGWGDGKTYILYYIIFTYIYIMCVL